jgi:hypothetical protein
MPNFDPTTRFWIGILVTIAIGVSGGTLNLTHAVPGEWIPIATAWCGVIAFIGSAILTALNGLATTTSSRIASAASVNGVNGFNVDQKIATVAREAAGNEATVTTT